MKCLSGPVLVCWLLVGLGCGDDTSSGDGGITDGGRTDAPSSDGGLDAPDGNTIVDPESPLPPLPELTGVRAWVDGDTGYVTFDPIAGAVDYRIYLLPDAESVVLEGDELVAIRDGWFRCGGEHQAPEIGLNGSRRGEAWVDARTMGEVAGYVRGEADMIVGHVWLHERPGTRPVWALGDPNEENECERERFNETRSKRYTDDVAERDELIGMGWRNDGVAFYRPDGDEGTTPLYENVVSWDGNYRLYYTEGAERDERGNGEEQLRVLAAPGEGTVPLFRVNFTACGGKHDELIAGEVQMDRATHRGNIPVLELQWPGLTETSVLVVEALSVGCPFQGHVATRSVTGLGYASDYPSIAEVQTAEANGQLFVNAQHDPDGRPTPTHRSYVELTPSANPDWETYLTFDAPFALREIDRSTFGGEDVFLESDDFLVDFYSIEPDMWALDSVRGELWVTYSDWAADTNGKFRLMPKAPATLSADNYLHTRMDVDIWSTGRRYPQMWITNVAPPMQRNLEDGTSINIQTINAWANDLQVQVCQNRSWDVNNQCPNYPFEPEAFSGEPWPPAPLAQEHSFPGRKARLDAYASTERIYLFLDGEAYGCGELPAGAFSAGDVRVAFGDVLYHSGVDEPVVGSDALPFIADHQLTETRRYFDNLGFESGVSLPAWPDTLPCHAAVE